jgi:hypothetical protein
MHQTAKPMEQPPGKTVPSKSYTSIEFAPAFALAWPDDDGICLELSVCDSDFYDAETGNEEGMTG